MSISFAQFGRQYLDARPLDDSAEAPRTLTVTAAGSDASPPDDLGDLGAAVV
jgi:hypothetical protein